MAERWGYRHVGDALLQVARTEGACALWTGTWPTLLGAMALNCGSLASYDQTRELVDELRGERNSRVGIVGASAISGFVGAVFSIPFDYVKTQLQRMKPDAHGRLPYDGMLDCVVKTAREHGLGRFFSGFPTYAMRVSPMIALTWLIIESIQVLQARRGW